MNLAVSYNDPLIPAFYRPGDTMRAWARERKTQEPLSLLDKLKAARVRLLGQIDWDHWDQDLSHKLDVLDYFLGK